MTGEAGRGAYGLRLPGFPGAAHLLRPAGADWPTLTVTRELGTTDDRGWHLDEHSARYHEGGGSLHLDRAALSAHFVLSHEPDDEAWVHPLLALPAAVTTRWLGHDGFHAGGFVHGGGVWGVLGQREAGKSSLLAQLHLDGVDVVTDDLLVVREDLVLPGPACLDLRPGAAEHFGVGEDLGVVGSRSRHRVHTRGGDHPLPLRGWVLPSWGEACVVARVPLRERVPLLLGNLAMIELPPDPGRVLDLASLPFLSWRRPRRWSDMSSSTAGLLAALA